jgi:hypothetical protein
MKIKTFDTIDQIHQIWNDSTWIRYNTILNEMGMIDLTPEQEEALFPEVPDYFIVDGKVYKPTIAEHVEYYSGKVDDCSYYRITLNETTDSDTLNKVNEQLRKEGREELKQNTESWLDELMKTHPWIEENKLVLHIGCEDGQIDSARLTMNGQILATIDKERPNKSDVEDWLNQLAAHKTFIKWIVNQTQWSIEDVSSLPNDIENIWISKPITLSESNTAQVTINIGRMNKTYVVKLAKPLDVDYIKAIVEFPVNDEDFVVSLRSSTQVKCTSGFTLSEHIAVPDTTQLGSILKSGVKEARTALNKHNQ